MTAVAVVSAQGSLGLSGRLLQLLRVSHTLLLLLLLHRVHDAEGRRVKAISMYIKVAVAAS